MTTPTRQKIACYMIVLVIVIDFILQDTLGKIKMTLLSEITEAAVAMKSVSDPNDLMHSLKSLPRQISIRHLKTLSCLEYLPSVGKLHMPDSPFFISKNPFQPPKPWNVCRNSFLVEKERKGNVFTFHSKCKGHSRDHNLHC